MLPAIALAALVAGGAALPPPLPSAVPTIPDEPEAVALPDAPTYQAVAADIDGDGAREVVRLVRGERGSIDVEAWRETGGEWGMSGTPLNVVPVRPTGAQGNLVYSGAPVQLVVRRVPGGERLTLVRQPRFEEPGLHVECCLLVHDLVARDGQLTLAEVAERGVVADALLVVDLDGDGTDELLVTRSLPPLGDIAYPTEARVFTWAGGGFRVAATELPIGSGDSPFVLGDSDGLPGDEAAILSTLGRPGLFRIALGAVGLVVDEAGVAPADALAVPISDGRGVALLTRSDGVTTHRWPRGEGVGAALGQYAARDGELVGTVASDGGGRLLFHEPGQATLHSLPLPELQRLGSRTVSPSPTAAQFAGTALRPYSGPLPDGGFVHQGRPLLSGTLADPIAALPGVEPIGSAGFGGAWLALFHAPLGLPTPSARGGRLDAPTLDPGAGVSLAPVESVLAPEQEDGAFTPPVTAAVEAGGQLHIGPVGATAEVVGPPGSRVTLAIGDPSAIRDIRVVPRSGWLPVPIVIRPPGFSVPNPRYPVVLTVTTPAGRGYVARWDVRVITDPPALSAAARTATGSASVLIAGSSDATATVTVGGEPVAVDRTGRFAATIPMPPWPTAVEIVAVDPLGNEARVTVTGVGWLDYRGLPWTPISVALVGLAALALFLRVPRLRSTSAPARADEGTFEEMEPD